MLVLIDVPLCSVVHLVLLFSRPSQVASLSLLDHTFTLTPRPLPLPSRCRLVCCIITTATGTVHAISRGVVFLKCMEMMDRGGFLVVRNRQVRVRGSNAAGAGAGGSINGSNGPVPASVLASPRHAPGAGGPQNPFAQGGGAGGAGGRGGGGGGGRGGGHGGRGGGSALLGQELMVRSGPYARYKGRVKQETATHLQVGAGWLVWMVMEVAHMRWHTCMHACMHTRYTIVARRDRICCALSPLTLLPLVTLTLVSPCSNTLSLSLTHSQLELDAINRIVTVKKEDVLGKQGIPARPQQVRVCVERTESGPCLSAAVQGKGAE